MATETTEIKKRSGRPPKQRVRVVKSFPKVTINMAALMAKRQAATGQILAPSDVIFESGVSKHVIGRAIRGTLKEMPLEELGKLMTYFNASADEIFKKEDEIPAE